MARLALALASLWLLASCVAMGVAGAAAGVAGAAVGTTVKATGAVIGAATPDHHDDDKDKRDDRGRSDH